MDDGKYKSIIDFVRKKSGIVLGNTKSYLIESRLNPIAEKFSYVDIDALERNLISAPREVQEAVVDAMTTNESFFFRDNTPFDNFKDAILPELAANARKNGTPIRIWCAAASTGQEPYSLAMVLMANKRIWAGLKVEIIATDISHRALERAKIGKYTQFEVQRGLPVTMLVDHFVQDGTHWTISDEIKKMIVFKKLNLLDSLFSLGKMDLVFCRNVLIYFDVETKSKVVKSIQTTMNPGAFMVLGGAETLLGISDDFERKDGYRGLYCLTDKRPSRAAICA